MSDAPTEMRKKPSRSIDAVAWDLFEASHPEMFELTSLGNDPKYLRNRIWTAFLAGVLQGRENPK